MVPGIANPLPTEGVIGHLTPEQTQSLKDFWSEFFKLIELAPEIGTGLNTTGVILTEKEAAGGSIPKDDDAKERLKTERETAASKEVFSTHGSKRFLESFFKFVAFDSPDAIALRFLRARKWKIEAAIGMLSACIKWRIEGDVESIFEKGEEGMMNADGFINQMSSSKTYTQGTCRYGRPVIYVHVAKHRTFDQSPKALEDFVIFQMETNRALFADGAEKVTMVFDMTGFGIRNMDWKCILFIVKCLEAYYPESLNVMLIHAAPWIFQSIWKILAGMLDPVVRNKVEMTKTSEDLQVHIDKAHLVKELGGDNDWEWKYQPVVPGENELQSDVEGRNAAQSERNQLLKEFISITKTWINTSGPSTEDDRINKERELIVLRLKAQYLILDPFIRGKGAYHRHGNIAGNGLVHWDYPASEASGTKSEWEILGYKTCRENYLVKIKELELELQDQDERMP